MSGRREKVHACTLDILMDFNDVTTDVTHAANVIMRHQVAVGSSETKTLSFRWGKVPKSLKVMPISLSL